MEHIKALCEQSLEMCHVKADGTYRDHTLQRVKRVYITVINVSVYAQSFKYLRFKSSELLCCVDGKELLTVWKIKCLHLHAQAVQVYLSILQGYIMAQRQAGIKNVI